MLFDHAESVKEGGRHGDQPPAEAQLEQNFAKEISSCTPKSARDPPVSALGAPLLLTCSV